MKEWYSASELAGLPGVPRTHEGVIRLANRKSWEWRKRSGRGGGKEYAFSSLPKQTRDYLLRKAAQELAKAKTAEEKKSPIPVIAPSRADDLSELQREVMHARLLVLDYIDELTLQTGSANRSVGLFIEMLESGALPDKMVETLRTANARSGKKRLAHRATIYRWMKLRASGPLALAPRYKPKQAPPDWLPMLLVLFQRPQGPSVAECVREWVEVYPDTPPPPLRTAQRYIQELPVEVREWGRKGRNAMRAVQPFVRRTTDGLWPMDVVTVDGHLFKAYVRHPLTGRRFRPEVTTYLDVATRRAVGFSAWIAESQFAIWGALSDMVLDSECGVPAIHYSDNGAYRGEQHRKVLARIGTTMMFSEAYRAQARGVIERFNSSVWVPLAKRFPTYVGKDMDKEAVKKALRLADETGEGLMSWDDFVRTCRRELDIYNARQHTSLGGKSPDEAWAEAVEEGWRPTLLEGDELHDLLPSEERKVNRGEVRLPWGRYFSDDLALHHGKTVRVAFHPTDGRRVWVSDTDGRLIAVAERDANARPYVHDSMLAHSRAQREQARIGRLEKKMDAVLEEGAPVIAALPAADVDPELHAQTVAAMTDEADGVASISDDPRREYAYFARLGERIALGEPVSDEDRRRYQVYWNSPERQSAEEIFESFGLAVEDFA